LILHAIELDAFKEHSVSLDADGGAKVLSEKTGNDDNFLYDGLGPESIPANLAI
jgi:hypothetical protein